MNAGDRIFGGLDSSEFLNKGFIIIAETMDRDLEQEDLLGDIIRDGRDPLLNLNDTDGQEGEDDGFSDPTMEEEGGHDGSGDPTMKEEGGHDGSGDRMSEEGDHDDGSRHTWIISQILWLHAISRNLGSSSLPHSS